MRKPTSREDVPEIADEDQASYVKMIAKENYFAGMRISTINADQEETDWNLKEVLSKRRIENDYRIDDSKFENLNKNSIPGFEY